MYKLQFYYCVSGKISFADLNGSHSFNTGEENQMCAQHLRALSLPDFHHCQMRENRQKQQRLGGGGVNI